ncbi:MAG: DUF6644 family protein [Rhodospirillales bacterium]
MEHAPPGTPAIFVALQESAVGEAMRQWLLLYPLVEIVHLVGIALLVGSIVCLDLRLMGLRRKLPASFTAQHLLPVTVAGLCLVVASGSLLFTTEAASLFHNPAFRVKLILIALGGVNAALFHLGPWRRVAAWEHARPPLSARLGGAASMGLWIGVLTCGRLIAYL